MALVNEVEKTLFIFWQRSLSKKSAVFVVSSPAKRGGWNSI